MSLFNNERRRRALAAEAARLAEARLKARETSTTPFFMREQVAGLIKQAQSLEELKNILTAFGENSVKTEEELALYEVDQRANFTGRVQALAIEGVINVWLPLYKRNIEARVIAEGRDAVRRHYALAVNTQVWRDDLRINYGTSSAIGIHAKVIELVAPLLQEFIANAPATTKKEY